MLNDFSGIAKMFNPVFDYNMFAFLNERKMHESGTSSKLFFVLEKLLRIKIISLVLGFLEFLLGLALALPIPIYKDIIHIFINQWPGLPNMSGMYLRALYYKRIIGSMAPNVFIDQNVTFAYPKNYTLAEFCYVDKNVMIMSNKCSIGRRVHIAPNVFVSGGGDFEIGDYAGIAAGCTIITSTAVFLPLL